MTAMTPTTDQAPSAERLLAAARGAARTPVLLIDLQRVEDRYRELRAAFAEAEVLYAVKANPQPEILTRLAGLGCGFDIASPGELDLCQALGRPTALLSYGNPAKKEADIAAAHAAGVGLFAFDSQMELEKLARAAPGAATVCRLSVSGAGAQWPLTHKFGCTVDQAVALLVEAKHVGLKPAGIAFHVGSQQTQPEAWRHAIHRAGEVFRLAARAGVSLEFLNLGGGLPAHYSTPLAPLATYVEVMRSAVAASFGASPPRLIIEPGRYMVGDAGALVTEVVLVADRPHERVRRWVYVDAGVFSGFDETMGERIRYRLCFDGAERPTGPVVVAGPTCDSADILYHHGVEAPLDLAAGERVVFLSAGAYTTSCSSVGFNGFPPLTAQCL
jgi:ornithine decarboxylase